MMRMIIICHIKSDDVSIPLLFCCVDSIDGTPNQTQRHFSNVPNSKRSSEVASKHRVASPQTT